MRSNINLNIELTHSRNLHTDAQGIATEVEAFLTNRLAQYDNLGSAFIRLQSAAVESTRERELEELQNAYREYEDERS